MVKASTAAVVRLTDSGFGSSVVVDGQDISRRVTGLTIEARPGRGTRLTLDLLSAAEFRTDAGDVVYHAAAWGESGSGPTPAAAIRSLLARLEHPA